MIFFIEIVLFLCFAVLFLGFRLGLREIRYVVSDIIVDTKLDTKMINFHMFDKEIITNNYQP